MKQFLLFDEKNINVIEGTHINNPTSVILHIHGIGAHFQFVYNSMDDFQSRDRFFSKFNIKSFGLEFEGHGLSDGLRCSINNIDNLVDNIDLVIKFIRKNYSQKIFLMCESMGCAIALKYTLTKNNNISGLIFYAPLIGISDKLKPNIIVRNILLILANIVPTLPLISTTKNMSEMATTNNDYLIAKEHNPYFYKGAHRLCTGKALINISEWINENGYNLETPILIFHGLSDCITDPSITENIFKTFKSQNKELYLLNGAYHCLLIKENNDPLLPELLINKTLDWIKKIE
jgi:alpha-beta hydrolase superfamily lysophospholipase